MTFLNYSARTHYSEVRTTGTLPGKYTIKIEPNAKGVVHPVRRQPAALKEKIVQKLHAIGTLKKRLYRNYMRWRKMDTLPEWSSPLNG